MSAERPKGSFEQKDVTDPQENASPTHLAEYGLLRSPNDISGEQEDIASVKKRLGEHAREFSHSAAARAEDVPGAEVDPARAMRLERPNSARVETGGRERAATASPERLRNFLETLPLTGSESQAREKREAWLNMRPSRAVSEALFETSVKHRIDRSNAAKRVIIPAVLAGGTAIALGLTESMLGGSVLGLSGATLAADAIAGGAGVAGLGIVLGEVIVKGALRLLHSFQEALMKKQAKELL